MFASVTIPTKRWAIMHVARELFTSRGYEQTTLNDICNRLALTETEFHEHFPSMDDLLEAVWAAPRPLPPCDMVSPADV